MVPIWPKCCTCTCMHFFFAILKMIIYYVIGYTLLLYNGDLISTTFNLLQYLYYCSYNIHSNHNTLLQVLYLYHLIITYHLQ
jgi:hypothetical protein